MSGQTLTLRGRVATDLSSQRTIHGHTSVRFRLCCPQWRLTDAGEFQETSTQWYTVKAWDKLGDNLMASLRKGQKVIVIGRPVAEAWADKSGEVRSALSITAVAVGHDLSAGIAQFYSPPRTTRQSDEEANLEAPMNEPRLVQAAPQKDDPWELTPSPPIIDRNTHDQKAPFSATSHDAQCDTGVNIEPSQCPGGEINGEQERPVVHRGAFADEYGGAIGHLSDQDEPEEAPVS
ncbi:single-stranded DNA-binding protein [Schaalia suimastitidis]|uniref:single-stranded DNA-binding protein n=1 Tax=Schaalia suimastitidis TaxID=121163 RepID=UPI0003FB38CF|nr:single-stranded DNA-binding protein [Schaalia suimastitidis]